MNKHLTIIMACILATTCLTSCSKRMIDPPPPILGVDYVYPTYSNLFTGNYWIYEDYIVGDNMADSATGVYDSVYVDKDTIVNSLVYYRLNKPSYWGTNEYTSIYLRDSADCIVDLTGRIRFSASNFSSILYSKYLINPLVSPVDSLAWVTATMTDRDKMLTTPAGMFRTSSYTITWMMHPYFARFGPTTRKQYTRYAAGVGMVSETLDFFTVIPTYVERRLVRYKAAVR